MSVCFTFFYSPPFFLFYIFFFLSPEMDYFAKFTKRIVPPKAQPTSAMQLAKFHKCWEYVHVSFILSWVDNLFSILNH